MSSLLKRIIIIVFSLHLGEPLVLDLIMLSFISLPYTILHHNFQFLLLVSSYQAGNLVILDTMTSCSGFSFFLGIFMFLLMFLFSSWVHGVSYRFHALEIPLLSFIIGSRMWMDNEGYFKAALQRRLLLRSN
jgi:hypothetical protein